MLLRNKRNDLSHNEVIVNEANVLKKNLGDELMRKKK
jgi:hypothetical protein